MAIASAPMPYNTLIGPDYREENVYPEEHPGLVIIHDSPDEKAKAHWHPGLEFVYSSHGSCPFIVDGQEMPLNTGDLLLINPYSIHYGIPTDTDGTTPLVLSVTFNDEVLERLYPFADRYMFSLRTPRANKDDLAQLARLGEDIIRWQQSDEAIRGFKLNMLLYELLSLLYSRFVSEVRRPELVRSEKKHHHADHRIHDIAPQTASRSDRRRTGIRIRQGTFLPPIPQGDRQNVQRISDRPAIGRRLQKTVRFLCVDSQHRKGMRFPRYARAADGRATQIRHTRRNTANDTKIETDIQ